MKYQAGYEGQDSMRDKAERMFRSEMEGSGIRKPVPQSMSSKGNTNMRNFARGGSTTAPMSHGGAPRHHAAKHHALSREQSDLYIPRRAKTPPINVERFSEVEHMKRGGPTRRAEGGSLEARASGGAMRKGGGAKRHYDFGGFVKGIGSDLFNAPSAIGNGIKGLFGLKKGGSSKHRKADGGSLNGENPVSSKSTGGAMRKGGGAKRKYYQGGPINQAPMYTQLGQQGRAGVTDAANVINRPFPVQAAPAAPAAPIPQAPENHDEGYGIGNMFEQNAGMRRGGRTHQHRQCKAGGGTIYEREMVGERPSRTRPHINYESDMRGEHGHFEKPQRLAAGGVGKMRHGVANAKGFPIKTRRVVKGY